MALSTQIRLQVILFHLAIAHDAKEKLAAWNPGGKKHAAVFSSHLVYSQLMDLAKDRPLIVYTQMQAAEDK